MPDYQAPPYQGDKKIGVSGPITKWVEASPDNDADLPNGPCRAVMVNDDTDGNNVDITMMDGTTIVLYIPKGYIHPVVAKRVRLTGTTATQVLVGY